MASVHPRARGEHCPYLCHLRSHTGSSPRTRGTHVQRVGELRYLRFIPAHAGNTIFPASCKGSRSVHPRARGEHDIEILYIPRIERFIPAHAGNTGLAPQLGAGGAVHPRARGEHDSACRVKSATDGSSPRTRGTQYLFRLEITKSRFIPAHAGNTYKGQMQSVTTTVHPRARGEHPLRYPRR